MFSNCKSLISLIFLVLKLIKLKICLLLSEIDLSEFDTNKVENMSNMFNGCSSLIHLNIDNFIYNNVKNMSYMFSDCISL